MPWGYGWLKEYIQVTLRRESKASSSLKSFYLGAKYAHMKVVTSKSGLVVSVHENANISGNHVRYENSEVSVV